MFTPAATAARTASEPEWWNVPSPMFWTRWRSSVNGAMPIHCAPSPPICVMPVISPLPSGLSSTIVWQPMPAPTSVPSGALVELLCGQPEQKNGERAAIGSGRGRPAISIQRRDAGVHRGQLDPGAETGGHGARHHVGVEVELGGEERLVALVALADDAGRVRGAVERLLEGGLHERALLLDHEDLVESAGEAAHPVTVERPDHPQLQDAHAGALELALAEAEPAERVEQVEVRLAGGHDAEPGVRGALDAVHRVLAGVGERQLGARPEQRALELQRGRGQQVAVRHVLVGAPVPDDLGHDRAHPRGVRRWRCPTRRPRSSRS